MLPRYNNNYHSRVVILETRRARTAMPKRKFPRPGFLVSAPLVTLDQAYTAAVAQAGRPSAALTLASSSSCASSLPGSRELREPAAIGSSKARRDSHTSFVEPIRFHEARQDIPRIAPTTRGSRARTTALGSSPTRRQAALRDLDEDVYARSSVGPRASQLKSWEAFHVDWFGPDSCAFPLSPDSVRCVMASLKLGRYRSAPNLMSRAKQEHIALGFEWDAFLDQCAARCLRSVARGIGPARQSAVYDLERVATTDFWLPVVDAGPLGISCCLVVGPFFMLRELEAASAKLGHVVFTSAPPQVHWELPTSKTDLQALGVARTWGCVCEGPNVLCPVCFMARHVERLGEAFPGTPPDQLPLFPTIAGGVPQKRDVVKSLEVVLEGLGLPVLGTSGNRLYGGHSMRVTGAQYLAAKGLDPLLIQLLGRWGSEVVLRYIQEAPLSTVTAKFKEQSSRRSLSHVVSDVVSLRETIEHLDLQPLTARLLAVETRLASLDTHTHTHTPAIHTSATLSATACTGSLATRDRSPRGPRGVHGNSAPP